MKDFQSNKYDPQITTLDGEDITNLTDFYIQTRTFSPGFLSPNSGFILYDSSFYQKISQENFQIQETNYRDEFQDQSNIHQSSSINDTDDDLSSHPIQIKSIKLSDRQIQSLLLPYEPNNQINYWINRSLSANSNSSSNSSIPPPPPRPKIDDEIQAESIQIDDEIQVESTPLENYYFPSSTDNFANNSSSYSPNIESKNLDSSPQSLEANSLIGFRINNSLVPDFKMIEQTGSLLFLTFEYLTKNLKNCLRPSNHIRSSIVQNKRDVSAEIVIGDR